MKSHPTSDWEWEETAEINFQEWFNDFYSDYTLRAEWFFGDTRIGDEKTREDMMYRWVHSAFLEGYKMGKFSKHNK